MQPASYGPFPYVPINRRKPWKWPNGARLALWVIPNLEFFHLGTPLHDYAAALKSTTETVYDTRNPSPPPIETTSATEGEGESWPVIWLVVTVVGIAIAVYLLL